MSKSQVFLPVSEVLSMLTIYWSHRTPAPAKCVPLMTLISYAKRSGHSCQSSPFHGHSNLPNGCVGCSPFFWKKRCRPHLQAMRVSPSWILLCSPINLYAQGRIWKKQGRVGQETEIHLQLDYSNRNPSWSPREIPRTRGDHTMPAPGLAYSASEIQSATNPCCARSGSVFTWSCVGSPGEIHCCKRSGKYFLTLLIIF